MRRFKYFSQCDRFRRDADRESQWQEMMATKSEIEIGRFLEECDPTMLLDADVDQTRERESLLEFVASDPTSKFCLSSIRGETVYFIQTCGFEFIFTRDGCAPCDDEIVARLDSTRSPRM